MSERLTSLIRSMPLRLALGLVVLFAAVSLISLAASYVITQRSFEQAIRENLTQDMAGFRAAPSARALAALVEAEARETDPERMILSYLAPTRRHYGNAMIARDDEGYHVVSVAQDSPRLQGRYLALTATLHGGQLTIARSWSEIEALRRVFANILVLSLLPTVLIALWGGLYLARSSARQVRVIGRTLDRLTSGDLEARVGPTRGWSADLAQIGGQIDEMAEAQESSVETLRQVSSDIAHDLKTPIQRVAVHLEDLAGRGDLGPDSRALVERASGELEGIVSVFHALLQIAQIESGSPRARFRPVDLAELCRTFFEIFEPAATESGHRLSLDVPAEGDWQVTGDRTLLGQMLANLIENALRHTPPGTAIEIGLARAGGRICLAVADDGPGVPEAERALVLRRLYRLDRSRTTPGSGLGLNMVQVIATLHDAELALSDNGPGLRVAITF